jgi:hypothetical protein
MNKKGIRTMAVWGLLFIGVLFGFSVFGISMVSPGAGMMSGMSFMPLAGLIYGRKIFDWKKIKEYGTVEEARAAIIDTAAAVMERIKSMPVTGQKMRGPDADLVGANPVALVMSDAIKTPDRGYELLFDEVDMRQSSNDSFDVLDVHGGATFYQIKPGEEVKITKIGKAVKTSVGYLRFAGALNILDDWLRFNKYYLIDRLFEDTIRNWWTNRATLFYGLLAALGAGINEAFDTDDITTINNACADIQVDLEAAGYPVDENAQFVITCNPKLRARILKALKATIETQGINKQIEFNISSVVNTTKIVNTSYYVSLPGFKNQRGEWEDITARPAQRDEMHLGSVNVWTGAYNGIIGESKQHKRCALS